MTGFYPSLKAPASSAKPDLRSMASPGLQVLGQIVSNYFLAKQDKRGKRLVTKG